MYVALVNVDREKDQNVMLDVKGVDVSGRDIEIQRLESDKITDENTLEAPDKVSVQDGENKDARRTDYQIEETFFCDCEDFS